MDMWWFYSPIYATHISFSRRLDVSEFYQNRLIVLAEKFSETHFTKTTLRVIEQQT